MKKIENLTKLGVGTCSSCGIIANCGLHLMNLFIDKPLMDSSDNHDSEKTDRGPVKINNCVTCCKNTFSTD